MSHKPGHTGAGTFGIGLMMGLRWALESPPGENVADFSARVGTAWIDGKIAEIDQKQKSQGN